MSIRGTRDDDAWPSSRKALAHADAGGARARQAPPQAELEGALTSPPRQALTLRGVANVTSSAGKPARSACVPATQETQSTQCPRSWSGPGCGAPPSLLQSAAGTKTEIAAEAPNVAAPTFGEGATTRDFRIRAQTIAARAPARASLPTFPANFHHRSRSDSLDLHSPNSSHEKAVSVLDLILGTWTADLYSLFHVNLESLISVFLSRRACYVKRTT